MKRFLLGSTALVGAGLLSASALAQVELSISGESQFEAGYVIDEEADSDRDYDFRQDSLLVFEAAGVADNGLEYGGEIELDNIATDEDVGVDEVYVFFGAGFGEVRLGDKEGAAATLQVKPPLTGSGGYDGNYGDFLLDDTFVFVNMPDADNTRITYLTPELGGFQAGVSYAVLGGDGDGEGEGRDGDTDRLDEGGDFENYVEAGANWALDIAGFSTLLGAGVGWGEGLEPDVGEGGDDDDLLAYNVGANVGFGGFTVGAAYLVIDDSPSAGGEGDTIQTGATYEIGPWVVGLSAAFTSVDDSPAESDIYALSSTYALAPGLALYGDLVYINGTDDADEDVENTTLLVGTTVAW